jgi:hypothetical protein
MHAAYACGSKTSGVKWELDVVKAAPQIGCIAALRASSAPRWFKRSYAPGLSSEGSADLAVMDVAASIARAIPAPTSNLVFIALAKVLGCRVVSMKATIPIRVRRSHIVMKTGRCPLPLAQRWHPDRRPQLGRRQSVDGAARAVRSLPWLTLILAIAGAMGPSPLPQHYEAFAHT